jgi:hypothetical protein
VLHSITGINGDRLIVADNRQRHCQFALRLPEDGAKAIIEGELIASPIKVSENRG